MKKRFQQINRYTMPFSETLLFAKTHSLMLWAALIPAGFFTLTANEGLAVQLLFITIALDVVLGVALAIKLKRFSSHNMGRCIPKGIGYGVAIIMLIIIARLIPEANFLLYWTTSFFIFRELSSNIENLSLLGVEFPDKVMLFINSEYKDKEQAKKRWLEKNRNSF